MKKTILIVVGILIISGFAVGDTTKVSKNSLNYSVDDLSTRIYLSAMYPQVNEIIQGNQEIQYPLSRMDYPIGTTIWLYTITGGSDNSVKAIESIEDIDGDGIDDAVVTSEDNNIRCFSGGEIGTGFVIWTHNIYSGNIYSQLGLTIMPDVNNDGYQDVVVGATGGARLVRCISGATGTTIWTYDTHEYGGGGWVYQVDCRYDYNDDGIFDVLACAGDDSGGAGPKRAFCLNGVTGAKLWDYYLGGAGFSVIGVEDFTGDGKPDVVSGCTNEAETTGYAKGLNGQNGALVWTFTTTGSSVWAVEQVDDVSGDGKKDVIIGDFSGHIYGVNTANGAELYSNSIGSVIITRFEKLNDVNNDGHPDIIPAHSTIHTTQVIDGQTGGVIWSQAVADQPWNAARITDISGDSINDVVIGTLYTNNYCYFLNGVDGSELWSGAYGEAVDSINSIPDVVNDVSMEMLVGGRNGKLTCISGGLDATGENQPPGKPTVDGTNAGVKGLVYDFSFVASDPELDNVYYYIDWGGSYEEWLGPYGSGEIINLNHSWSIPGNYTIISKARDEHFAVGPWSDPFLITILDNERPSIPTISGAIKVKAGAISEYSFVSTDPEGNDVFYYINWGDTLDELIGPFASGAEGKANHSWTKGTYTIAVRARDIYGAETTWATLEVTVPRNRLSEKMLARLLFERFTKIFNILGLLLNY